MSFEPQGPGSAFQPPPAAPRAPTGDPPDSPWMPAAVLSMILPMLGLLTLRDGRDRKRIAWTVFAFVVIAHLVLRLLHHFTGVTAEGGENAFGTIVRAMEYLLMLLGGAFALIYTHDEAVRSYPQLGTPILFVRSIELPPDD